MSKHNKELICSRCKKEVQTYSEIVYSQGDRVCEECKEETLQSDKNAFDRYMHFKTLE